MDYVFVERNARGEIVGTFARPQVNASDRVSNTHSEVVAFRDARRDDPAENEIKQNMRMIKTIAAMTGKTVQEVEEAFRAAGTKP